MDARIALLCVAAALLAGPASTGGFPSKEDDSKLAEADASPDAAPSKRSPEPDASPADSEPPSGGGPGSAPMDVRFPEDSKQIMSAAEGENVRSKKSTTPQEMMVDAQPHTTTVCIQVRSDRPSVVCGPQVDDKADKAPQPAATARFAYPMPAPPVYPSRGYYDPARQQRPLYGQSYGLPMTQPAYGPPGPRPFVMRAPVQQPQLQFAAPSPARASVPLPLPQQYAVTMAAPAPAQAQSPTKYVQNAPAELGPKAAPAAGRAPIVYFQTPRTVDDDSNAIKQEDKYPQPDRPQVIIQKMPVPVYVSQPVYPTQYAPSALSSYYRFNCALQPDGTHVPLGLTNLLRGAAATPPLAAQTYLRSASPAAWPESAFYSIFGRSAASAAAAAADVPYAYYDLQGRAAQASGDPAAYAYDADALAAMYGDEAAAFAMAGRSAAAAAVDPQQLWEQEQYLRSVGAAPFDELSARAAYRQDELHESRAKLQQMQQQLNEIEARAGASDKETREKKEATTSAAAVSVDQVDAAVAAQKSDPAKPVHAKKRRSNPA